MSKQPPKKNSYALLLKTAKEIKKPKPKNDKPSSTKKPGESSSANQKSSTQDAAGSQQQKVKPKVDTDPDIPDRSYGDYYCKICDSHMNAVDMWEAHVTGKRHIKNVEKGDKDSKYDDLPDEESAVKAEMKNVTEPVVGLDYIHEIRRREPNIPPIYNCFLCHASIATVPLVTEHVVSLKHRLNYIKENNTEEYKMINATNLKKGLMEPLVLEVVVKMEQEFGRGTVKVKQERKKKPFTYSYSVKKPVKNTTFLPKKEPVDDTLYLRPDPNPYFWQPFDPEKRRFEEISNREFDSSYRNRSRSRSPLPRDPYDSRPIYSSEEYSRDYSESRSYVSVRDPAPDRIVYEQRESFPRRKEFLCDYLKPPRKDDQLDYRTSRHHARPEELAKKSLDTPDRQLGSSHFLPRDMPSPTRSRLPSPTRSRLPSPTRSRPSSKMSLTEVLKIITIIPMGDRYHLIIPTLNEMSELNTCEEVLNLLKYINNIKDKLKDNDYVGPLMKLLEESKSGLNIPGLDQNVTSSAGNVVAQQQPHFPSQQAVNQMPIRNQYEAAASAIASRYPSQGQFFPFPQSSSAANNYPHKY